MLSDEEVKIVAQRVADIIAAPISHGIVLFLLETFTDLFADLIGEGIVDGPSICSRLLGHAESCTQSSISRELFEALAKGIEQASGGRPLQ